MQLLELGQTVLRSRPLTGEQAEDPSHGNLKLFEGFEAFGASVQSCGPRSSEGGLES